MHMNTENQPPTNSIVTKIQHIIKNFKKPQTSSYKAVLRLNKRVLKNTSKHPTQHHKTIFLLEQNFPPKCLKLDQGLTVRILDNCKSMNEKLPSLTDSTETVAEASMLFHCSIHHLRMEG